MLMNYCTGFISRLMHHCQIDHDANATSLPISYLSLQLYHQHALIIFFNQALILCLYLTATQLPSNL